MSKNRREHIKDDDFSDMEAALPLQIRRRVEKQFSMLQQNENHPSLHLKKVGSYWSFRVNKNYRALGYEIEGAIVWNWIGPHKEYEKRI